MDNSERIELKIEAAGLVALQPSGEAAERLAETDASQHDARQRDARQRDARQRDDGPRDDGPCGAGRRAYRCRFVRSGQVRAMGNQAGDLVIDPQALSAASERSLFDNKAVFVDHAGLFDHPSLRNLVGTTLQAVYQPSQECIEGVIRLFDTPSGQAIAGLIDEILLQGQAAPDVGLSVVFWAEIDPPAETDNLASQVADSLASQVTDSLASQVTDSLARRVTGSPARRVTGIRHVESVDLVFEPAADGRVLEALSTLVMADYAPEPAIQTIQKYGQGGTSMEPEPRTQVNMENSTQDAQEWLDALGKTAAQTMIAACGLPAASKDRLSQASFTTPDQVAEAIEAECAYLAKLQEDQVVQMGGPAPRSAQISGMRCQPRPAFRSVGSPAGRPSPGAHPAALGHPRALSLALRRFRDERFVPRGARLPGQRQQQHDGKPGGERAQQAGGERVYAVPPVVDTDRL